MSPIVTFSLPVPHPHFSVGHHPLSDSGRGAYCCRGRRSPPGKGQGLAMAGAGTMWVSILGCVTKCHKLDGYGFRALDMEVQTQVSGGSPALPCLAPGVCWQSLIILGSLPHHSVLVTMWLSWCAPLSMWLSFCKDANPTGFGARPPPAQAHPN